MIPEIALGRRIQKERERQRLSQEYMADKLGISQSTYSRYETGESEVRNERLLQIADILDVSLLSLLPLSEKQLFKIENNQTINGNVTNNHNGNPEIWQELIRTQNELIKQLQDQVRTLTQIIEHNNKSK